MANARKEDWQTKPLPANIKNIPFERMFTQEEMEQIKNGLVPVEMEDKWFIYEENGVLNFFRSWTGHQVYRVIFSATEEGYRVTNAVVNRDSSEYNQDDDIFDIQFLHYLIDRLLLNRDVPFPSIEQVEKDKAAICKHAMVGYGRSNKEG